MTSSNIKVWDIFIRIFHWGLVCAFAIAYFTEDDFEDIHVIAGYVVLGLITFRFLWGFIGSQYARFNSFIVKPSTALSYIKDIKNHSAKRYIGHNPAGAMMVLALIFSLLMTTVFGLMLYGAEEFSGPLANLMSGVSKPSADTLEEVHEFFANFTLFLIILHILGVISASYQHKENLVVSMFNGKKRTNGHNAKNKS